ncbi:hypothetical protein CPB85DRAFT_365324 [Mucidula mucida]|nr:hypothetical protein CPB85DRAFT_365324 [Mucidula mucida]
MQPFFAFFAALISFLPLSLALPTEVTEQSGWKCTPGAQYCGLSVLVRNADVYIPQVDQVLSEHQQSLTRDEALQSLVTCNVDGDYETLEFQKRCKDQNQLCISWEDGTGFCGGRYA